MKKFISIIIVLLTILVLLTGCKSPTDPTTPDDQLSFSAGEDVSKLTTDADFTQAATGVVGTGATTYSSSEINVATVDSSSGLVHLVGAGTTVITASNSGDAAYNSVSDDYSLTVSKADQSSFSAGDDLLKKTDNANFTQAATGVEGTGATTYSSSDEAVATVDINTGEVHIIGIEGTATITAANAGDDTYNSVGDSYLLTVTDKTVQASFSAGVDQNKLITDTDFTQTATGVEGTGITIYSSSDTGVATINSSSGLVSIIGSGTTIITADNPGDATYAHASDTYTVTVSKVVQAFFSAGADVSKLITDADFTQV